MAATKKPKAPSKSYADALSYWADERVPELAELLREHSIDAASFESWLGPCLGNFRGHQTMEASKPPRVEELEALQTLREQLRDVLHRLGPGGIPPNAAPSIHMVALRDGWNWFDVTATARSDLQRIAAVVGNVEQALRRSPAKRGRPSAVARNALAAAVVDKLRELAPNLGAQAANALGTEILLRCGVQSPGDLKRAVRAGRK